MSTLWLASVTSAIACALLTRAVLNHAISRRLLDVPNERSSHQIPTPRGGGLAIVVVVSIALAALVAIGRLETRSGAIVLLAGAAVATVGWLDDRRDVSALLRILVHAGAVGLALAGTRHLGSLDMPFVPPIPLLETLLAAFALVWLLNLFNFMDGIDGIAAGEAVFVALGMAVCLRIGSADISAALIVAGVVAGAAVGFLVWNWPPARIFMGDVGSGFLGFSMGALALFAHRSEGLSLWVPTILLAVFVTDATLTLLRRMLRGERWHAAHRSHAYQWLARRFKAHLPVTIAVAAVNLAWLLPLAIMASIFPAQAPILASIAYAPLIVLALLVGSGRPEQTQASHSEDIRRT